MAESLIADLSSPLVPVQNYHTRYVQGKVRMSRRDLVPNVLHHVHSCRIKPPHPQRAPLQPLFPDLSCPSEPRRGCRACYELATTAGQPAIAVSSCGFAANSGGVEEKIPAALPPSTCPSTDLAVRLPPTAQMMISCLRGPELHLEESRRHGTERQEISQTSMRKRPPQTACHGTQAEPGAGPRPPCLSLRSRIE